MMMGINIEMLIKISICLINYQNFRNWMSTSLNGYLIGVWKSNSSRDWYVFFDTNAHGYGINPSLLLHLWIKYQSRLGLLERVNN